MDGKTLAVAIVAALFGGGGGGFLLALFKAPQENRGLVANAADTITEAATRLVGDLDKHIDTLTKTNDFYRQENADLHAQLTERDRRIRMLVEQRDALLRRLGGSDPSA